MFCINVGPFVFKLNINDEKAVSYFEREYKVLFIGETEPFDFIIDIVFKSKHHNDDWIFYKARNRRFWYKIEKNSLFVHIPYSYKENDLFKLFNPSYESKSKMCLLDFFHNVFLSFLQIHLLDKGFTLFHASGVACNEKTSLFFGYPQSGKSSLVFALTQNFLKYKPISEDFCIIGLNNTIFPLQHSTRVDRCWHNDKKIINMLNLLFCRIFRKRPIMRLSFDDYFRGICSPSLLMGKVGRIYILNRKCENESIGKIDKNDFVSRTMKIMTNEFNNFIGFDNILNYYNLKMPFVCKKTEDIIESVYNENQCLLLSIPYFDNICSASEKIDFLLKGLDK